MLIGYRRVSTDDQDHVPQLEALKAAGCARCFGDTAAGSLRDRPQLKRALEELRDGEDTLVVWRRDRLGRSLSHLIELMGELERRHLGFRSLTEGVDTTTPSRRLVFHIFGAIAEFERQLIRERTQAGLNVARARGRRGGRRTVMTEHSSGLLERCSRGVGTRCRRSPTRSGWGARRSTAISSSWSRSTLGWRRGSADRRQARQRQRRAPGPQQAQPRLWTPPAHDQRRGDIEALLEMCR